jgi:hypothetical protein
MQVAEDDGIDCLRCDAECGQPLAHRLDHFALTFFAHRLVETGIDDDRAGRSDDRPHEKIKRLQNVVWIIVDKIR